MVAKKILGMAVSGVTLLFVVGCQQAAVAPTVAPVTPSNAPIETPKSSVQKTAVPKFSDMASYVDFVVNNTASKDFMVTSVPVGFKYFPTGGDKTKKMNFASVKTDKFVALYSDYVFDAPGGGQLTDAMNFYLEFDGNFYGPFVGTVAMTQ